MGRKIAGINKIFKNAAKYKCSELEIFNRPPIYCICFCWVIAKSITIKCYLLNLLLLKNPEVKWKWIKTGPLKITFKSLLKNFLIIPNISLFKQAYYFGIGCILLFIQ